jgi:fructoselysine-6-phosphate deglycase
LGSGGAGILMLPAARLLRVSSTFPVHVDMPAEIVVTGSAQLGPQSLVVIPSLSGTTEESIELQSLLLALSVVHCRGEYDDALRVFEELQVLPEGLLEAKRGFEAQAEGPRTDAGGAVPHHPVAPA